MANWLMSHRTVQRDILFIYLPFGRIYWNYWTSFVAFKLMLLVYEVIFSNISIEEAGFSLILQIDSKTRKFRGFKKCHFLRDSFPISRLCSITHLTIKCLLKLSWLINIRLFFWTGQVTSEFILHNFNNHLFFQRMVRLILLTNVPQLNEEGLF